MDAISVRGAQQHNLQGLDLDLPLGSLTVFCGPSGSGKSSLAFDTLHAEAQRRYVDVLALNSRGLDRGLPRPEVDSIDGLPPTVALSQRFRAPAPQATVGTWTEAHAVLSVLFGRCGTQHCPSCDAPIEPSTHDEIVAELLALPDGTRLHVEAPVPGDPRSVLDEIRRAGFSRVRARGEVHRLEEVRPDDLGRAIRVVVDRIKVAPDREARLYDAVRLATRAGRGAMVAVTPDSEHAFVDRPWCLNCDRSLPELRPRLFALHGEGRCTHCAATGLQEGVPCRACGGSRLGETSRAVRFADTAFDTLLSMPLATLTQWIDAAPRDSVSSRPLDSLAQRVGQLRALGLELPLGRGCASLSSGELQRLRVVRQIAAQLSGVLYVLDEPGAGLDDLEPLVALLRGLVAQGNTVVAVSHREALLRAADHIVEFGPAAGIDGGRIVFQGVWEGLMQADTATGQHFATPPAGALQPGGSVHITDLALPHRTVTLSLPWNGLGVLTGPSGSGKSTSLVALEQLATHLSGQPAEVPTTGAVVGLAAPSRVVRLHSRTGRMHRSTPATWSGLWDTMRPLLAATQEAQVRGIQAGQFSLNQAGGRCEACKGTGEKRIDLALLADVVLPCPSCHGRRFSADVLEVHWKGRNADEILRLRVSEAQQVLSGHPKLESALRALAEVGLGYVPLGQPAHTLSGGETQRLRLARELARTGTRTLDGVLYLIDAPERGLHPRDVSLLIEVFKRLIERGATVWVASNDAQFGAAATGGCTLP